MPLRLVSLVVDAVSPATMAGFWSEALGWAIDDSDPHELALVPTDGTRFDMLFEPGPGPKRGKNPVHLDLTTASHQDFDDLVRHLIEAGAGPVDIGQSPDDDHVVLADPEGNELCVLAPGNRFLEGCGRFGSITCDGTPTAGYFWSAALDWPLVWDQDDETAIRAPEGDGPLITWGPPVAPKWGKNRLHLDVAPPPDGDQSAEVRRLIALGARRLDIGQGEVSWVVMADPDGHEFCVLAPR